MNPPISQVSPPKRRAWHLLILLLLLQLNIITAYSGAAAILNDDFDSYGTGQLAHGQEWPSSIPGSDPEVSWKTRHYGLMEIIDAAPLGRSGNVFHSAVASEEIANAYSHVQLASPYKGEEWTVSVDIYTDSLSDKAFNVVSIFDGAFGDVNKVASISLLLSDGGYVVNAISSASVGASARSNKLGEIALNQWYTLSITGNNKDQTLKFTLTDGVNTSEVVGRFYSRDTRQIDSFAIGAMGKTPGSVYFDNFAVIPEPGSLPLLGISALAIGCAAIVRGQKKRNSYRLQ